MNDVRNRNNWEEIEKIREETQDDGWTLTGFIYDKDAEDLAEISNTREFLKRSGFDYDGENPSALTQYVHMEDLYDNMDEDHDGPIHCTNLGRLSVDPQYLQKQLQASLEKAMDKYASFALISTKATQGYRGHRCLYGKGIIHTQKCSIPVKWEMLYDQYFKGMVWI